MCICQTGSSIHECCVRYGVSEGGPHAQFKMRLLKRRAFSSNSRIENRLLNLEQMLRSIITKTDLQSNQPSGELEHFQEPLSPSSSANVSAGASNQPAGVLDPLYNIGLDMLANTDSLAQNIRSDIPMNDGWLNYAVAPLRDTVDGMGVITFGNEAAFGYFGSSNRFAVAANDAF